MKEREQRINKRIMNIGDARIVILDPNKGKGILLDLITRRELGNRKGQNVKPSFD